MDRPSKKLPKARNELRYSYAKQVYAVKVLQAVAFPSITAFVILAASSFYLIQSLAIDIHQMKKTMANMNAKVSANMDTLTKQLETSQSHMSEMVQVAETINQHVHQIHGNLRGMASDVQQMDTSTQDMAASVHNMQRGMKGITP